MADPAEILDAVVAEVDNGKRAALCVIVATRGSTPQPAGVMVCVDEQAKMTGRRLRRGGHSKSRP